jgi:hypothetical protein
VRALCGRARGRGAVRAGAPGALGGERMDLGILGFRLHFIFLFQTLVWDGAGNNGSLARWAK